MNSARVHTAAIVVALVVGHLQLGEAQAPDVIRVALSRNACSASHTSTTMVR